MIVEELLELPPWLTFEGVEFHLELFSDGPELRLCYKIASVDANSPHKAEYDQFGYWLNKLIDPVNPPAQGFLMLYESIQNDADLVWAARSMWYWLTSHGFHEVAYTHNS